MKNFKDKKLLILAGQDVHCKVVKAAKEMGVYTIVADYLDVKDSPAKQIADEHVNISIVDVDAIVNFCRKKNVDGVLNFCNDSAQRPYQQICEKLGVHCYGTKEQFEVLTDKRKFKDYCKAHNVDVIPEYTERDILEGNVEYPVFVKPSDSRGSRGQAVCYNKTDALNAIDVAKKESCTNAAICEKYMGDKQDIASAIFVVNGVPYPVKFGDRHLGRQEDGLDKQVICTMLPSEHSDMFINNVFPRVKKMIQSLGIKFGPVFMQGFVDGDTIRYYDPGFRMPGGDYDLVLKEVTGFDTVKSMIHFALTGDTATAFGNPENAYMLCGGKALLLTLTARAGKICAVKGMNDIDSNKYVMYSRQILPEGSIVYATGDIKQRIAAIGAYLPEEQISDFLRYVYSTYQVLDENGEDMLVSKLYY